MVAHARAASNFFCLKIPVLHVIAHVCWLEIAQYEITCPLVFVTIAIKVPTQLYSKLLSQRLAHCRRCNFAVPSPPQSAHNCRVNCVSPNPKRFPLLKRCTTNRAQSGPTRPDLSWRPTPRVVQCGWAGEGSAADAAPAPVSVSLVESAYCGGKCTEFAAGRFRHAVIGRQTERTRLRNARTRYPPKSCH